MAFLRSRHRAHIFFVGVACFAAGLFVITPYFFASSYIGSAIAKVVASPPPPVLDKANYNIQMLALAHINSASTTLFSLPLSTASTTASSTPRLLLATATASTSVSIAGKRWPHAAAYPEVGALLPFNRIVAYYGNFYSTGMGVLGEYPPDQMLAMLASTTASWATADPTKPVIPAIDYIAVTAQASPGADGKYRARMPDDQIQKAIALAGEAHGIVILDVQVGKSTLQSELPLLAPYFALPQVELAIDPEFSIKDNSRPGLEIGTMDATDINFAANYLASLVKQYNLPPKILVVHRFTEDMVTNYKNIMPLPEVQIVMDMDGFGSQAKKFGTYTYVIAPEPVEFTGFKLFYKNDNAPGTGGMLSPQQVLSLTPSPVFIQYQ